MVWIPNLEEFTRLGRKQYCTKSRLYSATTAAGALVISNTVLLGCNIEEPQRSMFTSRYAEALSQTSRILHHVKDGHDSVAFKRAQCTMWTKSHIPSDESEGYRQHQSQ